MKQTKASKRVLTKAQITRLAWLLIIVATSSIFSVIFYITPQVFYEIPFFSDILYILQAILRLTIPATGLLMIFYLIYRRLFFPLSLIAFAVVFALIGLVSTDYQAVSFMSSSAYFTIGLPAAVGVVWSIIDAARLIKSDENVRISKTSKNLLITGAVIGSLISTGTTVLLVIMVLSVRACQLSGSSKCL